MFKNIVILVLVALVSVSSFADGNVVINPGTSVLVMPGERLTVSCTGTTNDSYVKCELEWDSTMGDPMPAVSGIGLNIIEAMNALKQSCTTQPGQGNARKCASLAGSASCKRVNLE